jgi:dolichyl-phosphooligosaccharide-protein glycotransferase
MSNQSSPQTGKKNLWLIYGLILVAIFGAALALRVVPMYQAVFGSSQINLQGVDGVYHLRLVENLLAHFPFRINFDPYTFFPYGQSVYFAPLFDLLAGLVAWVVGLGAPNQHTIETVAAFFPAVQGALITIPVYFIGKKLFNRNAGIIAAALIGVFPGTLLFRSRLGFFDHHVTEILFSTLAIMFLVLALKHVQEHPVSFQDLRARHWRALAKPLIWSALCGISLGCYLLAWVGGLLFVFLIFCWIVAMFIIEHLRKQSTDYLGIIGVPLFLLALIVVAPLLNQIAYSELYVASLAVGLAASLVLALFANFLKSKNLASIYFPLSLAGVAVILIIVLFVFFPSLANSIFIKFKVFTPDENGLTVSEMRPMFLVNGHLTLSSIWSEFNYSIITGLLAFILLCVGIFRKFQPWQILLLLWSILVFTATAGQIRFATYLGVVVAILAAFFFAEICGWIYRTLTRSGKLSPTVAASAKHASKKHSKPAQTAPPVSSRPAGSVSFMRNFWAIGLCLILVFFAGIYPNLKPAIANAKSNSGVNSEWQESLLWMKNNTPEPFQDPNFYYARYTKPANNLYPYPATAYGVMAWWDYGHMITEVAHRIPNANPNQSGAPTAANFFISQNEQDANRQLDAVGTRYIMIDFDIAVPYAVSSAGIAGKKFYAMPTWAGTDQNKYCEIYYQPKNNQLVPVPIYYPEYYYCMVTRLYNFHGAAVVPANSTTVISFEVKSGRKVIQSSQTFANYEEASAFLKKQTTDNFRLVGTSPFVSPVPLAKLAHYQEVHDSPSGVPYNNQRTNSAYIEIFEYKP